MFTIHNEMGICTCCYLSKATQRHHRFSQTKTARRKYGKAIDDPKNIQHVCANCHASHAGSLLDRWNEREFCEALGIEYKGKTRG